MRTILLCWAIATPAFSQCPPGVVCPLPGQNHAEPAFIAPAAKDASQAVARVIHQTAKGNSLGSATLIFSESEASYFLTCAHLFEDGAGQTLLKTSRGSVRAKLIRIDRANDLALLRTRTVSMRPVAIAQEPPEGNLTACGFGQVGVLRCVRGPIVGYATPRGATSPSIRIHALVRPGDSGGAVFNRQGRLCGVVWGARDGETYATFGSPFRKILEGIISREKSTRPSYLPNAQELKPVPRGPAPAIVAPAFPTDAWANWRGQTDRHLKSLDVGLEQLHGKLTRVSDHLTNQKLTPTDLSGYVRREEYVKDSRQTHSVLSELRGHLDLAVSRGEKIATRGLSLGSAFAIGGPPAAALLVGQWLWRRRRNRREPPDHRHASPLETKPIAVDSPPPPQRVVPETHYVSYERDDFARAHQWASEQLARKYPGSIEWLTSLDSLIKQHQAGDKHGAA